MSQQTYHTVTGLWIFFSIVIFIALLKITVPYGRHIRRGWGLPLSSRLGWFLMEAPSPLVMALLFITGSADRSIPLYVFFILWEIHYANRAFIFPLRIRGDRKNMTLHVVLMAVLFNLVNGYLNGYYLFSLSGGYSLQWLYTSRFILGTVIFVTGFAINQISDGMLRRLRERSSDNSGIGDADSVYQIPEGFLFSRISCPNYFGEILEWCGWAVLTWSFAGLSFAVWTAANLIPRALSHHRWYQEEFSAYPQNRSAVIPFVL
jgi:hypothetical protein